MSPPPGEGLRLRRFLRGPPIFPSQPDAPSHVPDDLKFSALPASVPEPGTYALLALGLAALAWNLRREKQ